MIDDIADIKRQEAQISIPWYESGIDLIPISKPYCHPSLRNGSRKFFLLINTLIDGTLVRSEFHYNFTEKNMICDVKVMSLCSGLLYFKNNTAYEKASFSWPYIYKLGFPREKPAVKCLNLTFVDCQSFNMPV